MHTDPNGMIGGKLFPPRRDDRRSELRSVIDEQVHIRQTYQGQLSLEKAMLIVEQIDQLRAVQRELKAAFKDDELNGGWKAALEHPLWGWAEQRIAELHEEMKGLV